MQSLEAELVAIEQYFIHSRAEQKIRPEDLEQPVRDLREEIAERRGRAREAAQRHRRRRQDATHGGRGRRRRARS